MSDAQLQLNYDNCHRGYLAACEENKRLRTENERLAAQLVRRYEIDYEMEALCRWCVTPQPSYGFENGVCVKCQEQFKRDLARKDKEEKLRVAFEQITDICGDILNGEREGPLDAIGDIEVVGTEALKMFAEEVKDETI
jgi:hypothetical protein